MKRKISILGSTGSVGTQTLELISENINDFEIISLTGGNNESKLEEQIHKFNPSYYFSNNDSNYSNGRRLYSYEEILKYDNSDLMIIALSGIAGINPTILSVQQGRRIALANKESLVAAGDILIQTAKSNGAEIIPLDSEHSAIWQCINKEDKESLESIILTASGGALRDMNFDDMKKITVDRVLKHPTWEMGKKITVDSSTLINKVFEVQEASNLFTLPLDKIKVLFHRESIIHGMAQFKDGNIIALLSYPDMKIPILYGLYYPQRSFSSVIKKLDLNLMSNLSFQSLPEEKLGWYNFGLEVLKNSKLSPSFLVGSDQAVVEMFLDKKIGYFQMLDIMKKVYDDLDYSGNYSLESIKNMINMSYQKTLEKT